MKKDAARLALAVQQRRAYLGLTQAELRGRKGPAETTVNQIENGKVPNPSAMTLGGLDRALEWEPGSAAAVLAGGEPRPLRGRAYADTATVGIDGLDATVRSESRTIDDRTGITDNVEVYLSRGPIDTSGLTEAQEEQLRQYVEFLRSQNPHARP